jgi:hypothetical protein
VHEQPDYAPAWEILGAIDAGLGDRDNAIDRGPARTRASSVSKDAWDGPTLVTTLALIYTWVGEKDLALQELAASAQMLVSVSYGELQLSPNWDRFGATHVSTRSSLRLRRTNSA